MKFTDSDESLVVSQLMSEQCAQFARKLAESLGTHSGNVETYNDAPYTGFNSDQAE